MIATPRHNNRKNGRVAGATKGRLSPVRLCNIYRLHTTGGAIYTNSIMITKKNPNPLGSTSTAVTMGS